MSSPLQSQLPHAQPPGHSLLLHLHNPARMQPCPRVRTHNDWGEVALVVELEPVPNGAVEVDGQSGDALAVKLAAE